ncbi:MAG: hypothetical protein H7335_12595 [Massilia sp.]|nr:hypothetical protein [Massilia sp.]
MDVIITLEDAALVDLPATRKRLVAAGGDVIHVNKITGTASARIEPGDLGRLRAVPGVLAVEASENIQIAPPDSPIQ